MKNINPIIVITSFLAFFFLLDLFLLLFLLKIDKLSVIGMVVMVLVGFLLGSLIYGLHFGVAVSTERENFKDRLSYTMEGLVLDHVLLQQKEIIDWKTVEAIFLSNSPPLDGEYHNFEYLIFLNAQPTRVDYQTQSWYNKMALLPKTKPDRYPLVRINDHKNRDFAMVRDAIKMNLAVSDKLEYNLGLKFGNEIKADKMGAVTNAYVGKPLKTLGLYKIFDRNNPLDDETLTRFRKEAQN